MQHGWFGWVYCWVFCLAAANLGGCATPRQFTVPADLGDELLFEGDLQQIAPLHDGDQFTMRLTGHQTLPDGIYVERVACPTATECVLTLEHKGEAKRRSFIELRPDYRAAGRLELLEPGLVMVHDPPLPSLGTPLRSRAERHTTTVRMLLASEHEMARGRIQQTRWVRRLPPTDRERFEVHRLMTMELGKHHARAMAVTEVVVGIGAVRTTETADDGSVFTTEQVCAVIAGEQIGTCLEE